MAGGKDKGSAIVGPSLNGLDASVMIAFNDVMDINRNAWKPDGEIVAHSGQPVRVDADFFAPPPAKIGQVVTAESTLHQSDNPLSAAAFKTRGRVIMAIVFLLIAGAVVPMFIGSIPRGKGPSVSVILTIFGLLVLIGGFVALVVPKIRAGMHKRKLPSCSYVGVNGVVRYTLQGCPDDGATDEMLLFDQAEDLVTTEVRNYYNGVYTGTNYKYDWRDAEGESLMTTDGVYKENSKKFTSLHPYIFLLSAEEQWCEHRFERLKAEFETNGNVQFIVDAKRAIRIGPGYIEFLWPDGNHRVPVEDFGDISINEGVFRFKHRDATWLGRKGKFNFKYGKLPNAKLFLAALDQLAGISWSNDE